MNSKDLILVLGFGRSGTSALTRVISLCGCSLPEAVFGATRINPTGHWEPVDATNLNVDLVSRLGIVDDPRICLEDIEIAESEREDYIRRIQLLLSQYAQGPIVIKEFRINELMEFWLEAARRGGFSAKVVIALRHPQEVFASLKAGFHRAEETSAAAAKASIERFNTFWLKTNLLAERHSRRVPRLVIEYSNLMMDWRNEMARMSKALAVDLKADEAAIDLFLTADLHRQRYSGPVTETFAYGWITRVYAILSGAAQDRAMDLSTLDEIYHGYRTNSRAFRWAEDSVDKSSNAEEIREFVDRLPIWKSNRDF